MRMTWAIVLSAVFVVVLYYIGSTIGLGKRSYTYGLAYGVLFLMLPTLTFQILLGVSKNRIYWSIAIFVSIVLGALTMELIGNWSGNTWALGHGGFIVTWPILSLVVFALLAGISKLLNSRTKAT